MDPLMMEDLADVVKMRWDWITKMDIKKPLNETSDAERAHVLERLSKQGPPPQFRLIDCKATSEHKRVVLVDGHLHDSFTAVSHTWGQEVYGTFDCECAAECRARVRRCSGTPCLGHDKRHREVIVDILKMCNLLMLSGSEFVWHDGVCIAQYDAGEVEDTIRHMGWIYSKARDTVIFLDYVGRPRALVKEAKVKEEDTIRWRSRVWTVQEALLTKRPRALVKEAKDMEEDTIDMPRWRSRVWTVQEALLTKRRRYCIRRCAMSTASYINVPTTSHDNASGSLTREESLMAWISACDEDDSCTAVVEEEEVWAELVSLYDLVSSAFLEAPQEAESPALGLIFCCFCSLIMWLDYFKEHVFNFPSLNSVLRHCSDARDSKHPGDRINSVLGLAGITDFVADKDKNVEHSTIEFVKRLGQKGLRDALFWVNHKCLEEFDGKVHTWLPCLSSVFESKDDGAPRALDDVEYKVLENDMLQLTGRLCCVPVRFTVSRGKACSGFFGNKESAGGIDRQEGSIVWAGGACMDLVLQSSHISQPLNVYLATCARGSKDYLGPTDCLGYAVLPTSENYDGSRAPVIHGRRMKEGDTFSAHLVTTASSFGSTTNWDLYLLVQGSDLQFPVSRLGFFEVLKDHLTLVPSARWINRLVIN